MFAPDKIESIIRHMHAAVELALGNFSGGDLEAINYSIAIKRSSVAT